MYVDVCSCAYALTTIHTQLLFLITLMICVCAPYEVEMNLETIDR